MRPRRAHRLAPAIVLVLAAVLAVSTDGQAPASTGARPALPARSFAELQPPATGAAGPDSDAPPGATKDWLPKERWVLEHWLPYRERHLRKALRTTRGELQVWLNRKPLSRLAGAKGFSTKRILRKIMRPVRRDFPRRYRVLYARARRTFTQRHLMQHMLFHPLHSSTIGTYVPAVLGIGWGRINAWRAQGSTLVDVAARFGRSAEELIAGAIAAERATMRRGVRKQAVPASQARDWLREVRCLLPRMWSGAFRAGTAAGQPYRPCVPYVTTGAQQAPAGHAASTQPAIPPLLATSMCHLAVGLPRANPYARTVPYARIRRLQP